MSDARVQRLQTANERLQAELELPRVKVSEACKSLLDFTKDTKDALMPGARNEKENPYAKKTGGGCAIL